MRDIVEKIRDFIFYSKTINRRNNCQIHEYTFNVIHSQSSFEANHCNLSLNSFFEANKKLI